MQAVERWLVDRAVLPIENSLGGSIHRNYDLLLRHRLHIVGEVKFAVRHCLLANPGVKVEDLKRVLSHPQVCCTVLSDWCFIFLFWGYVFNYFTTFQALAQCENTLTKLGLVREAVDDTAGAAKVGLDLTVQLLVFYLFLIVELKIMRYNDYRWCILPFLPSKKVSYVDIFVCLGDGWNHFC